MGNQYVLSISVLGLRSLSREGSGTGDGIFTGEDGQQSTGIDLDHRTVG